MLAAHALDQLASDGFVVLPDLVDEPTVARIKAEVSRHTTHDGRNEFEGHRTRRVYALLDKAPSVAELVEHPVILELLDQLLLPGYLLSANLAIDVGPGETPQPWHHDDTFYLLDRPRSAVSYSAIWAIDDFTAANGATQVMPGSHRWEEGRSPSREVPMTVEMGAGSAVFFSGMLWHRGGRNETGSRRMAITPQYCEPWARQQENMMLAISEERTRQLSPRLQGMLGYSIHPPFMGHIDGLHPLRRIRDDYDSSQRRGTGELLGAPVDGSRIDITS
jgi:ectoine hydroxylase-related dioxygenase (phytanoyl-CoA dioxygenase family)